jgi:hypothetical protein
LRARDIAKEIAAKEHWLASKGKAFRWSEPQPHGPPPSVAAALLSDLTAEPVSEAQAEGPCDGLLDCERPELFGL